MIFLTNKIILLGEKVKGEIIRIGLILNCDACCLVTVLSDPLCPYKPNVPGSSVLHYQSLSLLKFLSFDPVMLSNHLILC